jgi:hypothetical protein
VAALDAKGSEKDVIDCFASKCASNVAVGNTSVSREEDVCGSKGLETGQASLA